LHDFACISPCCGAFWALSWILFIILWFSRASQGSNTFPFVQCFTAFSSLSQQPIQASSPFGPATHSDVKSSDDYLRVCHRP
jgi:hypothetical protein